MYEFLGPWWAPKVSWNPCWIILGPRLEKSRCRFGVVTMILALLRRDTVLGRLLETLENVKPLKTLIFYCLVIIAISIDA